MFVWWEIIPVFYTLITAQKAVEFNLTSNYQPSTKDSLPF